MDSVHENSDQFNNGLEHAAIHEDTDENVSEQVGNQEKNEELISPECQESEHTEEKNEEIFTSIQTQEIQESKETENNELINKEERTSPKKNGDRDSVIDVKHGEEMEVFSPQGFENKLKMWSYISSSSDNSAYPEDIWQQKNKFNTIKQIKKGNTRSLMERFEFF